MQIKGNNYQYTLLFLVNHASVSQKITIMQYLENLPLFSSFQSFEENELLLCCKAKMNLFTFPVGELELKH